MTAANSKPGPLTEREVTQLSRGQLATDGDGVRLTRIIGTPHLNMLDPFLLLDAFESDQPEDYIGGFPNHPHRGFETVTYLFAGQMRHKDSSGNEGVIKPGGVQWMTAGKGIVHSEMPEQVDGLLMGFQLWVNLPRSAKMSEPGYQEFPADEVALEEWSSGTRVRVIAGCTDKGTEGPVKNAYVSPTYLDVQLKAGDHFKQVLADTDNAFLYQVDGDISVGRDAKSVGERTLAVLSAGDQVSINAKKDSRFLLVAGQPLNEPVARGGPFVMNSKAEVLQAFEDFQTNRF
jgi:redox-sensitive bicupin YhaK (pirin superfamily)